MRIEDVVDGITRYCNKPVWKATEYLLARDTSWLGTAKKAASVFAIILTAPLSIFGETLHYFFQRPYLSYESQAPQGTGVPRSFMSLNACMFQGGLPIPFGGVTPAGERMDRMAAFIKDQDVDVACLQEVAFDPATQLIDKLKDHYRYFYYRIGPNPYRMESALFWASKFPLTKEPTFIPFNIPGMQGGIRRGFFIAEFENCRVITTHLDPGVERGEIRACEIEVIAEHMNALSTKPLFLIGDLNIEPGDERAIKLLAKHFKNFRADDVRNPTEAVATCYDNLPETQTEPKLVPKWTVVDHVLSRESEVFAQRVPMFDRNCLQGALSDHHAVKLIPTGLEEEIG